MNCEAMKCEEEATSQIKVSVGNLGIIDLNVCNNCISKFNSIQYNSSIPN